MKKVIIIDDSETARMFTRRCLEMAGLECEEFKEYASAKEAIFSITDPDVDLVVVDLVMPDVSGKEFLKLRQKAGVTAPAVVVSSAVNGAEEKELKELGALLVLKKPLSPAMAAEALEAIEGVQNA